jgi:hypothetical protein
MESSLALEASETNDPSAESEHRDFARGGRWMIRSHSALGYQPHAREIIVPGNDLPMNHEAA